jgi:hypothetical protein
MQPFRAPAEILACSRCGVRLEAAVATRDPRGCVMCPPCHARFAGAEQDRRVLMIYLPIVFVVTILSVLAVFGIIALALYRAGH